MCFALLTFILPTHTQKTTNQHITLAPETENVSCCKLVLFFFFLSHIQDPTQKEPFKNHTNTKSLCEQHLIYTMNMEVKKT